MAGSMAVSVVDEQLPLVQNEETHLYEGEMEPERKYEAAEADVEHDKEAAASEPAPGVPAGPVGEGVVMGEPVPQPRQPWSTGLLSCLGNNDEFCSSDMEVCVLGAVAPCVLYGSNMERLFPGHSTFASHCSVYSSFFMMGNFIFNGNVLAPCLSFPSRIALRRSHNLEGHGEAFVKSCGCCSGMIDTEEKRERLDVAFDFAAHFCCHPFSLCQEGREIRRRTVHPAQRPIYYSMTAPSQQAME